MESPKAPLWTAVSPPDAFSALLARPRIFRSSNWLIFGQKAATGVSVATSGLRVVNLSSVNCMLDEHGEPLVFHHILEPLVCQLKFNC